LFQAARYLNVAPWELAARCEAWQEWAICFQKAEYDAGPIRQKIEQQRADFAGREYD
jgi:hypothetical protein